MTRVGEQVKIDFTTQDPTTGAAADADSLPTGTLIRNSSDTNITVTVTNKATGEYKAEFTIPITWSEGDEVQLRINATVVGVAGKKIIWTRSLLPSKSSTQQATESAVFTTGTIYGSVSDADNYFTTERLFSQDWLQEDSTDRSVALTQASRLIDNLRFIGEKAEEDQTLEFPRNGDTSIPRDIVVACYEIAYALLVEGRDLEFEGEQVGEVSTSFGSSRLRVEPALIHEAKAHSIPSVAAWRHLKPYLIPSDTITLSRVD